MWHAAPHVPARARAAFSLRPLLGFAVDNARGYLSSACSRSYCSDAPVQHQAPGGSAHQAATPATLGESTGMETKLQETVPDMARIYKLVIQRYSTQAQLLSVSPQLKKGNTYTLCTPQLGWLGAARDGVGKPEHKYVESSELTTQAGSPKEASLLLVKQALQLWQTEGLIPAVSDSLELVHQPLPVYLPTLGFVPSYIGNKDAAAFKQKSWDGPTHVIQSIPEARDTVEYMMNELKQSEDPEDKILGLDVESPPTFVKAQAHDSGFRPPTLVQVATKHDVFLFHINNFLHRTPRSPSRVAQSLAPLQAFLEDEEFLKVGVGVNGDANLLKRFSSQLEPRGFVDLQDVAVKSNFKTTNLRGLAALILGFGVCKSQQMSDWGKTQLSNEQIVYAATDAWVSRELGLYLLPLQ